MAIGSSADNSRLYSAKRTQLATKGAVIVVDKASWVRG